jgi:hypothetical protein
MLLILPQRFYINSGVTGIPRIREYNNLVVAILISRESTYDSHYSNGLIE